jgi:hypothetical protein
LFHRDSIFINNLKALDFLSNTPVLANHSAVQQILTNYFIDGNTIVLKIINSQLENCYQRIIYYCFKLI